MGLIKSIFWTVTLVSLGIFLGSYRFGGKTPVEHAQKALHQTITPKRVAAVKEHVEDAYWDAKLKLSSSKTPGEHHSAQDRAALQRLIAERPQKK